MQRRHLALASLAAPTFVRGQGGWPNKPVRIVVPFAAGGTAAFAMLLGRLQLLSVPVLSAPQCWRKCDLRLLSLR